MAKAENAVDEQSTAEDGGPLPVGVKLGSTRTVVAYPDGDAVDVDRTLTCLASYEDALTGEEELVFGDEAAVQYPDEVEYLLRSGLPEDEARAELASTFFQQYVDAVGLPADSAVVYAVPTIDNEAGIANLESVIESANIGGTLVRSYPESLCGAVPAVGDGLDAVDEIFVAINLGSTNLEVCAYRRGEQLVPYATGAVTGNEVDRRIASLVEEETQGRVNVDLTTAREYKETHADFDGFEAFTDVIQQPGGGAHEFTIERSVMDACDEYVDDVVDEVANTFLPTLATDYMRLYQLALSHPIVLTGGMACVPGIVETFEARLSEELNREIEAVAPAEPADAAAVGAHRIAERLAEAA